MRKIFTILILCCLVIYIGGYQLVYIFYQYNLKQEMREYLQTHTDKRFGSYLSFRSVKNDVKDPDFEWEEANREFRYKGEMYDVVSVKYSKDSIQICALKDDGENTLGRQLAVIHRAKQDSSSGSVLSLMKFFSAFYITDEETKFSLSVVMPINYPLVSSSGFLPNTMEIQTPPPRS